MGRARKVSATGWYHVLGRGNNRQAIFHQKRDFLRFFHLLAEYRKQHPVKISHYCLMTNHTHLLLFSESRELLSRFLQKIQLSYSWWYRLNYKFCGHVWQGRFKSFPIEKESYLLECSRYIERNPVRAEMVSHPRDYLWSSYRFYAEGLSNSLPLTQDPGYESLGETPRERQVRYEEYVTSIRPYELPEEDRLYRVFQ